eukprot:1195739-Prorocentrum_minimum.AAC.5
MTDPPSSDGPRTKTQSRLQDGVLHTAVSRLLDAASGTVLSHSCNETWSNIYTIRRVSRERAAAADAAADAENPKPPKSLGGELNSPVVKWLNKGLTLDVHQHAIYSCFASVAAAPLCCFLCGSL